jgi:CheY-like chemotaxis protein
MGTTIDGTSERSGGDRPIALLVEDDPLTQVYMRRVLRDRFEVAVASSVAEAKQQLATNGARTRVILMDLSLRGLEDGLQLTRALRSDPSWKDLPIIATTAHAFAQDERNSLDAGCSAYLAKPIEPARLLATIRRLVPEAFPEEDAEG